MTFIKIDANTLLNTDSIARIDLNHVRPDTQERCIRIELRAVPGLAESRMILLRYSLQIATALTNALDLKPLNHTDAGHSAPLFYVSLVIDGWKNLAANYAVCRIPCVGEHLILWDLASLRLNTFRVEQVCHQILVDASPRDALPPTLLDYQRPKIILLVSPCDAPQDFRGLPSFDM